MKKSNVEKGENPQIIVDVEGGPGGRDENTQIVDVEVGPGGGGENMQIVGKYFSPPSTLIEYLQNFFPFCSQNIMITTLKRIIMSKVVVAMAARLWKVPVRIFSVPLWLYFYTFILQILFLHAFSEPQENDELELANFLISLMGRGSGEDLKIVGQ